MSGRRGARKWLKGGEIVVVYGNIADSNQGHDGGHQWFKNENVGEGKLSRWLASPKETH